MAIKIIKKVALTNKTQSTVKINDVTNSKTEVSIDIGSRNDYDNS